MSVTSRETIRDAVALMLQTALTGSGQPVTAVYNYQKPKLGGETPIITVTSAGTARVPSGYMEDQPHFYLTLTVFVIHSADGWTEADAEAKLDEIEAAIDTALLANQQTDDWQNIQYDGRSTVQTVISLDGFLYRREIIPILVECEGDD